MYGIVRLVTSNEYLYFIERFRRQQIQRGGNVHGRVGQIETDHQQSERGGLGPVRVRGRELAGQTRGGHGTGNQRSARQPSRGAGGGRGAGQGWVTGLAYDRC